MSIVSFFVNVVLLATVAIAATVVAVLIVGRIFRRVSYLVATKKLQMQNLEKKERKKVMDVTALIEILPTSVKLDLVKFKEGQLKEGEFKGQHVIAVYLNRLLMDEEKTELRKNKKIQELDQVWYKLKNPDVKMSCFLVVG